MVPKGPKGNPPRRKKLVTALEQKPVLSYDEALSKKVKDMGYSEHAHVNITIGGTTYHLANIKSRVTSNDYVGVRGGFRPPLKNEVGMENSVFQRYGVYRLRSMA